MPIFKHSLLSFIIYYNICPSFPIVSYKITHFSIIKNKCILQKTNDEWDVEVQWDDSSRLSYNLEKNELKIFDNGPAGICCIYINQKARSTKPVLKFQHVFCVFI